MSTRRILIALATLFAFFTLTACGGQEEEKKTTVQLDPVKAKVTKAEKTGADSGHPIVEVTGTLPGTGWTPQVHVEKKAGAVEVVIWAIPGPGATKGGDVPFTHKFVVSEAGAGMPARIVDHRGVELRRVE
ncbi:MAG: hypothetical protein RBU45_17750 [Myxococcota bacterium]|jgi:hypothetical protein|nr:hypothetical protein [Myxococcota bacterium]